MINFLRNIKREIRLILSESCVEKSDQLDILLDYLYCKFRFHITYEEYFLYDFYKYKNVYRKDFILVYHQRNKYVRVNVTGSTRAKYQTFLRFCDLVKREIIFAPYCKFDKFLAFVKKHRKIVTKPNCGSYGRGVELFTYENDSQAKEYFDSLDGDTLCEEFIVQHESLNEFNPFAVNSLRILTFRHDDFVDIICASFKMGTHSDVIVDNMHRGGIAAQVDITTGIVTTYGRDYNGGCFPYHPISGKQIIGFNIPFWEETKKLVVEAHTRIGFCDLLGWDIAITPDGPEIIETNNGPGPLLLQFADCVPKGEKILPVLNSLKNNRKE